MSKAVLTAVLTGTTIALGATGTATAQERGARCEAGEFCVWAGENYTGTINRATVETANPGDCVPLADGLVARSFANRLTRHVTVYQGETCSTEADFTTYPGHGTYVPVAPFVVRAIQVWD